MDLFKLAEMLKGVGLGNVLIIGVAVLSLIQITPLKIDPWSKFFKVIGKMVNGEVMTELKSVRDDLDGVHKELDTMKDTEERRDADAARNRILRFDDELRRKIDHSEEFFNQALEDVTFYRTYCSQHDTYPNAKADSAMRNIEDTYNMCKHENKFI